MKFFNRSKNVVQNVAKCPILTEINIGDTVKVCSDENKMRKYQMNHGGYSPRLMQCILGKYVKVKYLSYFVRISWENKEFDLDPRAIEIVDKIPMTAKGEEDEIKELFDAITQGYNEKLCGIMSTKLLNTRDHLGRTPINAACVLGNMDIVNMLLAFEPDLDIRDYEGNWPIQNCALQNKLEILQLLIEADENQINKNMSDGKTLLHIAVIQNNLEMTKYLISKNIDCNIKDQMGRSALCYLTKATNTNITFLLANGNDDNFLLSKYCKKSHMDISLQDPQKDKNGFSTISSSDETGRKKYYEKYLGTQLSNKYGPGSEFETIKPISTMGFLSDETNYENEYKKTLSGQLKESNVFTTIQPTSFVALQSNSDQAVISVTVNIDKKNQCKFCLKAMDKDMIFVECGHIACSKCAGKLSHCPMCKKENRGTMKIFI